MSTAFAFHLDVTAVLKLVPIAQSLAGCLADLDPAGQAV
jgi:hypothetical protein